jgi:hypothetical protein
MKKNGLVSALFVMFCLNVVLAQPPEVPENGFYFKKDAMKDKKNKREYNNLEQNKKSYDNSMYISEKNVSDYSKELDSYYKKEITSIKEALAYTEAALKGCVLNEIDSVLLKIPYNKIDKLQFATKPLDEKLVKELFKAADKEIEFAGTEWEIFDQERRAGYARHSLDGNGIQGVYLNEKAVYDLLEILEKSKEWRLPTLDDVMGINFELSRKKLSAFDVLAADDAKNKDNRIKWKKPGKDYYGMGLLPCGYKAGALEYPKPTMAQSSNFAIYSSEKDIDFVTNIGMVDLNEGASQLDYMVYPIDEAAFGVYVILFRKEK